MNRYPYRLPLSITSIGRSPSGEYLYQVRTVKISQWEHITRQTRPSWRVSVPEPLEGWEGHVLLERLAEGTPSKFLGTLWTREVPSFREEALDGLQEAASRAT